MSTDRNPMIDNGDEASGTRTGIRQAIAAAGPLLPLRDAQQLDLLAEEAGSGSISSSHVKLAARGRGRPQGARNRQTREVRDFLLSRYAHPLEVLAQYYSRPVDALAAELGCTKKEAAFLQVRAAAEVAPFVEGKMPSRLELSADGDFNLLIPGMNISEADAKKMADGEFVPEFDYDDGIVIDGDVIDG